MHYMFIMSNDSTQPLDAEQNCRVKGSQAEKILNEWIEEMDRRGVLGIGHRLEPEHLATTVRVKDGETLVADGPFGETKELIAGFHLINCADLDEAIEIASKHPTVALGGVIEIRPVYADG